MEEQIMNMPAVALRGLTILPGMIAHFDISRERSLRAVEEAMEQDQRFILSHKGMWTVRTRLRKTSIRWVLLLI